jgi:hypothetical protein
MPLGTSIYGILKREAMSMPKNHITLILKGFSKNPVSSEVFEW